AFRLLPGIAGQEDESGAVVTGAGQRNPEPAALALEKRVGHLDHDAGAVARVDLTPAGSAVQQVLQHGQGLIDDGMGRTAFDVHHEPDAASVVLVRGIVQALRWWYARSRRIHGQFLSTL